jgi:hypothetical protein
MLSDSPSCINSGRMRRPQSGAVRTMFLVPALVDRRARSGGVYRRRVAERAPYLRKQSLAASDGGGDRATARRPELPNELGESLHVSAIVFRVSDRIEGGDRSTKGVILRISPAAVEDVGDAHLVEVGVAGEGYQTGVLILKPEATGANGSAGLDHRNLDDSSYKAGRLAKSYIIDGVAVNTLYEAIAEEAEGGAESPGVLIGKAGDAQGLLD